jgi:hypothetical protein
MRLRKATNSIAVRPQSVHLYINKNIEVVDDLIKLINKQLETSKKFLSFQKQLQHPSLECILLYGLNSLSSKF